jgi:hypothetical protein
MDDLGDRDRPLARSYAPVRVGSWSRANRAWGSWYSGFPVASCIHRARAKGAVVRHLTDPGLLRRPTGIDLG